MVFLPWKKIVDALWWINNFRHFRDYKLSICSPNKLMNTSQQHCCKKLSVSFVWNRPTGCYATWNRFLKNNKLIFKIQYFICINWAYSLNYHSPLLSSNNRGPNLNLQFMITQNIFLSLCLRARRRKFILLPEDRSGKRVIKINWTLHC